MNSRVLPGKGECDTLNGVAPVFYQKGVQHVPTCSPHCRPGLIVDGWDPSCDPKPKTPSETCQAAEDAMQANQPMVFKPSPSKVLVRWFVTTIMMLGGIWVAAGGFMQTMNIALEINIASSWIIWTCVTLSIIALVLSTVVFGSMLTLQLQIDSSGFSFRQGSRTTHYRWKDITGFQVGGSNFFPCVVFDYTPEYHAASNRKMPKVYTGHEGMIPGYFAISPSELSDLLNSSRSRQIASQQLDT